MYFTRSSIVHNIVSKSSPAHPVFAARNGLNKLQHEALLSQMNRDAMRQSVRQFSRLNKNSQLFEKGNSLFRETSASFFKRDSPLVKQYLNQSQSRSQSNLTIPRPQTSNEKAMWIAAGLLGLGFAYFLLDKILNQTGTADTISPAVRNYLKGVYAYLAAGISITAASAVAFWRSGILFRFMGEHPMAWAIGSSLLCIGTLYACTLTNPNNVALKHSLFVAFTVLEGATLSIFGTLGHVALKKAGIYTLGIFAAMTVIALTAKHERFLYLGGALYSALFVMVLASFANMGLSFFGKMPRTVAALDALILWGGLALFTAFLLYHTQSIVQNGKQFAALEGSGRVASSVSVHGPRTVARPDYINEAMRLYMDIINIFIRLAIIFSGNQRRK